MAIASAVVTITVTAVAGNLPWWYCIPEEPVTPCPVRSTTFVEFKDYDVNFKYPVASSRVPSSIQNSEECGGCSPTLLDAVVTPPVEEGTPPLNTTFPSITTDTTFECGEVLSVNVGVWSGSLPMTFTYQWFLGIDEVVGATGASYAPPTGGNYSVAVVATNDYGFSGMGTGSTNISCG